MSELRFTPAPAAGLPSPDERRPAAARALRIGAIALIVLGVLALADAVVTLVWQEPITALYSLLEQDHLSGELRTAEHASPTPVEQHALASLSDESARIEYLARQAQAHTPNGAPIGRIWIPRVDARYIVVDGTDTEDLIKGPGIYKETNFPGLPGTTAIAGHRTTWLAPFREINFLKPGNHIVLRMPYAQFTYTVTGHLVVSPSDVAAAVSKVGYTRLVLSACTPVFSAAKRLLVYARLTRTVPEGAARQLPGGAIPQPIEAQPSAAQAPAAVRPLDSVLVPRDLNGTTPAV